LWIQPIRHARLRDKALKLNNKHSFYVLTYKNWSNKTSEYNCSNFRREPAPGISWNIVTVLWRQLLSFQEEFLSKSFGKSHHCISRANLPQASQLILFKKTRGTNPHQKINLIGTDMEKMSDKYRCKYLLVVDIHEQKITMPR